MNTLLIALALLQQTWVRKKPLIEGTNGQGSMGEGTFVKGFAASLSGGTFMDPEGKNTGSASWTGAPALDAI